MTAYTFNGTMNQTIAFDPAADTLALNVAPNQFFDIRQNGSNVEFITAAGAVLTLTNTMLTDLTNDNVDVQGGGVFAVGDSADANANDGFVDGTAFSDILFGLTGNDINAGDGDNLVFGGNGRGDSDDGGDVITAGDGNDLIFGNGGNDTITSGPGNDVIYGGRGADDITATPDSGERAQVFGGGGIADPSNDGDTLTVGAMDEIADGAADVFGNGGNDTISVYADGDNRVEGGRDDDTIVVMGDGDNTVRGGLGEDTITVTGDGDNVVFGGNEAGSPNDEADVITISGEGDNTVYGNGGNDTIRVNGADREGANQGENGDGDNTIFGGQGDDNVSLSQSDGTNLIYGNLGSDQLNASLLDGGSTTIYGGSSLSDTADDGDIIGIGATGGSHTIYGNSGEDMITVNVGQDATVDAFGGQDDDSFTATVQGDSVVNLEGNLGDDSFNVQTLTEDATLTMTGGAGDDTFSVGSGGLLGEISGTATLFGNQGEDVFQINNVNEGASLEIFGGQDDDQITISSVADGASVDVSGGQGEDEVDIGTFLSGVSGDLNVDLGDGDDELNGNIGADGTATVFGGNGEDEINLGSSAGDITAYGGTGVADSSDDDDMITTGSGDDTLYGNGGDDVLSAGAGDDMLFGGQGDDELTGGSGNDMLNGGMGFDTAVFTGDFDPSRVTFNIDDSGNILSFASVTTMNGGMTETDALTSIENLRFGNMEMSLQDFIDNYTVKVAGATGNTAHAFMTVADGLTYSANDGLMGNRVFVGAGNYGEQITVNEDGIHLIGANAGVDGSMDSRMAESILASVEVQANNVSLDGFTVNGTTGTAALENSAIYVSGDDFHAANNVVSAEGGATLGFVTETGDSSGVVISNNLITGFNGSDERGIFVNPSEDNDAVVTDNHFDDNRIGVTIADDAADDVSGNVFTNSQQADVQFNLLTAGDYDLSDIVDDNQYSGGSSEDVRVYYTDGSDIAGTDGNDRFEGQFATDDGNDGTTTINAGDGDDVILGSANLGAGDSYNGEAGADVIGGNLDGDTVNFGSDSNVDEAHFTTSSSGANGGATIDNFDEGEDFIAFLDDNGNTAGSVDFDANDTTAGAAGTKFSQADVGSSYFEFDFTNGAMQSEDGSQTDLSNADNAVVVINNFDSTSDTLSFNDGDDTLENSYVVVQSGNDAEIYYFDGSNDSGSQDFSDATLVATLSDTSVDDLNFDDFGVYGTGNGNGTSGDMAA